MYKNDKWINGPLNVARLEGKINEKNKIIYLFMDRHTNLYDQSECMDIESEDIVKYLHKEFKNANKKLDFFFEIDSTYLTRVKTTYRGKYIETIDKLFNKIINIDKKGNVHSKMKNIRAHYVDTRGHLMSEVQNGTNSLNKLTNDSWNTKYIDKHIMNNIKKSLEYVKIIINTHMTLLQQIKLNNVQKKQTLPTIIQIKDKNKYTLKEMSKITAKIYFKLKEEYTKIVVKSGMRKYIKDIIIKAGDEILNSIKKIEKLINNNYNKMTEYYSLNTTDVDNIVYGANMAVISLIGEIFTNIMNLGKLTMNLYTWIVDIYTLRRILDKDYVETAIVYTGIAHSANMIYMLNNYFDFKITHIAFNSKYVKNINELNKLINKQDHPNKIKHVIYPATMDQCSNLKGFPTNFD